MDRMYAKMQNNTYLHQLIDKLDARAQITVFRLDSYEKTIDDKAERLDDISYVYQLLSNEYKQLITDYVIEYIGFNLDHINVVIKPNRFYVGGQKL